MFAGITCHEYLVLAWVFVVYSRQAILADYQTFDGIKCKLMFSGPYWKICIAFFSCQRHEDGGMLC